MENRQRTPAVIRGGAPQGGNFALEQVATLLQNGWQLSARTGGNFRVERVATFPQNTQSYSLRTTKHRNHQAWFSSRIRSVYGYRCAFSNLPLGKLLVGAHIKADEDGGPASVPNGICMSTLHHAAFDSYLIGVDPDLRIHVSRNVFDADDGPLLASLQGLDGGSLRVPDEPLARPDSAFLEWRFDRFEAAQT